MFSFSDGEAHICLPRKVDYRVKFVNGLEIQICLIIMKLKFYIFSHGSFGRKITENPNVFTFCKEFFEQVFEFILIEITGTTEYFNEFKYSTTKTPKFIMLSILGVSIMIVLYLILIVLITLHLTEVLIVLFY